MLRKHLIKILKEYEAGGLNKGPQTSNHTLTPEDTPSCIEEFLDHSEEVKRNNQLKYVSDARDDEHGHYVVITYITSPNSNFLLDTLSDENVNAGLLYAEIERMKFDGLILTGTQKAQKFVLDNRGDFSYFTRGEGWFEETDSIILTTKGKSSTGFLLYQLEEHRFAAWSLIVSFAAFVLSAFALYKNFSL